MYSIIFTFSSFSVTGHNSMASEKLFNKRKNKLCSNTILFKYKNRNRRKFFKQIFYLLSSSSESSVVSLATTAKPSITTRRKTIGKFTKFPFNESSNSKLLSINKRCAAIKKQKISFPSVSVKADTKVLSFQRHRWKSAAGSSPSEYDDSAESVSICSTEEFLDLISFITFLISLSNEIIYVKIFNLVNRAKEKKEKFYDCCSHVRLG